MNTHPELRIHRFFDNNISSYQIRIQKIQTAFQFSENITESIQFLFDNVQSFLNVLRKEHDLFNSRFCEALAKNGSLRKKEYNTKMPVILYALKEKEKEAETHLLSFIETQKEIAQPFHTTLRDIKDITSPDFTEKINQVKIQLSGLTELQEK
jgi:hypothetical protein